MSSLEDDGVGDELSVLWPLESGVKAILPRPALGQRDAPELSPYGFRPEPAEPLHTIGIDEPGA